MRSMRVGGCTAVLETTHQRHAVLALYHGRDRIAEKLGLWSELAGDGHLVRGRDVEEARYADAPEIRCSHNAEAALHFPR